MVLYFSRRVSLQTWVNAGTLQRELALYLKLMEKGINVSFVTYGGPEDMQYANQLSGIGILCNRWNLSNDWYEHLLPFLHARTLMRAHVYKSNQTNGADVALRAARIWRKPFIARCGFMWSHFADQSKDPNQIAESRKIERVVFEHAQRIVVTTRGMKANVERDYNVDTHKINVLPNYVLTELFAPCQANPIPGRICCVGRLDDQKNLVSLILACGGLPVELHIIGEGQLRAPLQELAAKCGTILVLHGNLAHYQLPEMICQAEIFALVSHYEGHPKTLIEAMSCGVAVLGSDVDGIRDQIIHGETGWLVGADAESIRAGIMHLLSEPALREHLGRNARRMIEENFALDVIAEREYSILRDVARGWRQ